MTPMMKHHLKYLRKLQRIKHELFALAAEAEPQRSLLQQYYLANPPPPPELPISEFPSPVEYDETMQQRLIDYHANIQMKKSRYGLTPEDIEMIRSFMQAHRGVALSAMERKSGICIQTLRKYGYDLIVR